MSSLSVALRSFLMLSFIAFMLSGCAQESADSEMTESEKIERGRYLVEVGGCNDCHTPKVFGPMGMQFDSTMMLAGHPENASLYSIDTSMIGPGRWILTNDHLTAWVGPWGVSFSANITPDNATGIGTVSEEMFVKSLREGKIKGVGRPILPPMPWEAFAHMTEEDIKSIYAYLRTIPAVSNKVPVPVAPPMIQELYGKK